jgi:cation diffusion facilitator family transporter
MENDSSVTGAEKSTSITVLLLMVLGIIQIILGETSLKSVALTANGIDCVGDGFVSVVVWIGLKFVSKPADQKYHYGYFKFENIASIMAALVMFLLAGYIFYRSYMQFIDPREIEMPILGIIIALIAALVAWGIGFQKLSRGKKSNLKSLRLEAMNTIKDGTASFLTVIALVISAWGYPISDAIVGFIIAGIIVTIGFAAIKESGYILVDACDMECLTKADQLKSIVEVIDSIKGANIVRLRRTGPVLQGELEIYLSDDLTLHEVNKIIQNIQEKVKKEYPEIDRLSIIPLCSTSQKKKST